MTDHPRLQVSQQAVTGFAWLLLLGMIGVSAWSWSTSGILYDLVRLDWDAPTKIQRIREFFLDFGAFAPVMYLALVTAEVVIAPIPGLLLYAPGGAIFGPLLGGALSLGGNVMGAGIACLLARSLRPRWIDHYFSSEKALAIQSQLEQKGGWCIFFLRLNPLTSSDIVSYAAGFTRIPIATVMLATCLGMAPLCFVQAWLATSLLDAFPSLLYAMAVGLLLYMVVVALIIYRLRVNG